MLYSKTAIITKALAAAALCALLASCGGEAKPGDIGRSAVSVLEADGYAVRVRRGESRFEFVSPENAAGTVVSFDAEGNCAIYSPGGGADGTGIAVPIADGRGYHDWLVLAYPEDHSGEAPNADETWDFELDGASFSISPDGECRVTRGGLERAARRTDGE